LSCIDPTSVSAVNEVQACPRTEETMPEYRKHSVSFLFVCSNVAVHILYCDIKAQMNENTKTRLPQ